MKARLFLAALSASLVLPILCSTSTLLAAPLYHVINMGRLPSGNSARGVAINNNGQVVGHSSTTAADTPDHAFLYSNGVMTDLGTLPGGYKSFANGINNSGQIVGRSETASGFSHAVLWSNGTTTDLGMLPGGNYSLAGDINDSGLIVGSPYVSGGGPHAALYADGTWSDLGIEPAGISYAYAINNNNQIAGWSVTNAGSSNSTDHAFLYTNGVTHDLGTLGGVSSQARDLNDSGQVVGYSETNVAGTYRAFLYANGVMTDIGTTALGPGNSFAQGINNSGQIVGSINAPIPRISIPFLYDNGTLFDLTTLVDSSASPWRLNSAEAINDNGWIVGSGYDSGGYLDALLFVPVPEPSSFVLAALGLIGLVVWRRRKSCGVQRMGATSNPATVSYRTGRATTAISRQNWGFFATVGKPPSGP